MSKFEGLLDEFKGKAKNVYGVASKATGDVVEMGKVHYQIKQTQWEIEKTYAKLGSYVYDARKGEEGLEEIINLAIAEVDALGEKLDELERRLRGYKKVDKCPSCGKENDVDACYCSRCGEALECTKEEPPIEVQAEEVPEE